MIKNMVEKGISISEISRQMGIDRKTVRKYTNSRDVPLKKYIKRTSMLDPHKDKIKDLIEKYNLSNVRILEEIRKDGYSGGKTILGDYCVKIRKDRIIMAVSFSIVYPPV